MKKFVAMIMTLAMIAALAVPALATIASSGIKSYGGVTVVPNVDITCKYGGTSMTESNKKVILNPYSTQIKPSTTVNSANADTMVKFYDEENGTTAQVIAAPLVIGSDSNCGISVSVKSAKADKDGGTGTTNMVNIVNKVGTKATATLDTFLYLEGSALGAGDDYKNGAEVGAYVADSSHLALTATPTSKAQELFVLPIKGESTEYGQIAIGGWLQTEITDGTTRGTGSAAPALAWTANDKAMVQYTLVIVPAISAS